jgi:ATP-binding cassette subfamily B (MDR/TAP) protein 1
MVEGDLEKGGEPVSAVQPASDRCGEDPEKRSASMSNSDRSLQQRDSRVVVAGTKDDKSEELEDELAHLSENEREIIRRQIEVPNLPVTFFKLYRFSTTNDLILIAIGCITSIVGGAILPMMTILFGQLAQTFQDFALSKITQDFMQHEINRFTLYVEPRPLAWCPMMNYLLTGT